MVGVSARCATPRTVRGVARFFQQLFAKQSDIRIVTQGNGMAQRARHSPYKGAPTLVVMRSRQVVWSRPPGAQNPLSACLHSVFLSARPCRATAWHCAEVHRAHSKPNLPKGGDNINAVQAIPKENQKEFLKKLRAVDEKYVVLFLLGLKTGLRVSDILKLKVKAFGKTMRISESKTKKVKVIKLSPEVYEYVKKYIAEYPLTNSHSLIPSTKRVREKSLSRVQAHNIMCRVGREMGLELISTHSMRKSYAKALFARTGQIWSVQRALGHTHQETTMRYLVNFSEMFKKALT